jgi:Protein of unknown function (DUF1064)
VSGLKDVAEAYVAQRFKADVAKATKYRNVKTEVDGITFDSKLEAHRYTELKLMQMAGQIRKLEWQRPFSLNVNDIHVCDYVADFVYQRVERVAPDAEAWQRVVEDAKGVRTAVYAIKKKLMRACLGIDIIEIRKRKNA